MGRRVMVTAEPPKLQREGSIPSRPAIGAIVQPGEHYPRTVEIGVRVPAAPLNGPILVGYQPARLPHSTPCPFDHSWGRSSIGRASDWQSEGSRFDPGRLHRRKI